MGKLVGTGCSLFLGLLLACGTAERLDVGVSLPETHVARWQRDGAALTEEAKALGYRIGVAYANAEQGQQNRQIQDFITRGVKVLIVAAVSEGVVEAVAEAARSGVKVIAYDRLIMGSADYDFYVSFDNFMVGRMQGEAIIKKLKGDTSVKDVVLFAGAPTDNNARFFFDGAMSYLLPAVRTERIRVIGPAPINSDSSAFTRITVENWRADLAKTKMEGLLVGAARDRQIAAVLAPNDTLARAIIAALQLDRKYATVGTFPVVTGQDAELASIKLILEGWQSMTVFKDTRKLARAAIELADGILKGQYRPSVSGVHVDKFSYHTGKKTVTSYLIQPVLVDQGNVRKELVSSGFYQSDQLGF